MFNLFITLTRQFIEEVYYHGIKPSTSLSEYVLSTCVVRLYLSTHSRMPGWVQPMIPRILYITEKGWNFYPYTRTGKCLISWYYGILPGTVIFPLNSNSSCQRVHSKCNNRIIIVCIQYINVLLFIFSAPSCPSS